ncbi:hypothetical protein D3C87_1950980 [compost metagenome]
MQGWAPVFKLFQQPAQALDQILAIIAFQSDLVGTRFTVGCHGRAGGGFVIVGHAGGVGVDVRRRVQAQTHL